MRIFLTILVCLATFIANAKCLKLLLVFAVPSRSHHILGFALAKGLVSLGHEVTFLTTFEEKFEAKNYKQIVLEELSTRFMEDTKKEVNLFEMESKSPYFHLGFICKFGNMISEQTLNHTKVQKLINNPREKFDAVIINSFMANALEVLAHHFGAHLILFSPVGPSRWVNNFVANPENPSYTPDILLSFSSNMNFYQRFYNFIFGLISDIVLYNYFYPSQQAIMEKYFPNAPHLDDLQFNVSLVITNSHESINEAVPRVPNMIHIGGFHVNPPKQLSKDLKEFMDSAKYGVIYFSLGSNLVPSNMPEEKKQIILRVLGSRKEKVLWKWDEDQMEDKPQNVMISKWFPQQSILAHPNCKLFISHGGLLSLTETVYLGVPVLAFPIFGDQKLNAGRVKAKGFGLTLPLSEISEGSLVEALNELLDRPLYRANARINSKIMHDRPIKPIELADYWIKYVVRHKGAPHLRVAGVHLPLYEYYMLDVFAVTFGVLASIVYLILKLFMICRKLAIEKSKKD